MLLIAAIIVALTAAGCLLAAIDQFLRASANLAPGVQPGRLMLTPGKTNPELYTAVGQRHLSRYSRYALITLMLWFVAMMLFGLAGRPLG